MVFLRFQLWANMSIVVMFSHFLTYCVAQWFFSCMKSEMRSLLLYFLYNMFSHMAQQNGFSPELPLRRSAKSCYLNTFCSHLVQQIGFVVNELRHDSSSITLLGSFFLTCGAVQLRLASMSLIWRFKHVFHMVQHNGFPPELTLMICYFVFSTFWSYGAPQSFCFLKYSARRKGSASQRSSFAQMGANRYICVTCMGIYLNVAKMSTYFGCPSNNTTCTLQN